MYIFAFSLFGPEGLFRVLGERSGCVLELSTNLREQWTEKAHTRASSYLLKAHISPITIKNLLRHYEASQFHIYMFERHFDSVIEEEEKEKTLVGA